MTDEMHEQAMTKYTVYLDWTECKTDPIQYKPYSPTLLPESCKIAIEIPEFDRLGRKLVLSQNSDSGTILSPAGMMYVMYKISKAMRGTEE